MRIDHIASLCNGISFTRSEETGLVFPVPVDGKDIRFFKGRHEKTVGSMTLVVIHIHDPGFPPPDLHLVLHRTVNGPHHLDGNMR